jgi:glycerol-3-phosphate acyltransferase PlsY
MAYTLGSLPSGYIAGKLAGVDIRTLGSGNVGATNVTRVLGKRYGYPVFVVDFAKGLAAVIFAEVIARSANQSMLFVDVCAVIGAIFAVIGHSYPIWLKFRGGKGVATSIGALFALNWVMAVIVCVVWIAIFQTTRYVSLASIGVAIALPIASATLLFLNEVPTPVLFYFSVCLGAIVILRHRSNISRLLKGTEPRFIRK